MSLFAAMKGMHAAPPAPGIVRGHDSYQTSQDHSIMKHRPLSHPRGNVYVLTSVLLLCTHAALSSVEAAADVPAVAIAPGRLHMSYEVEVVRLPPDDAAAVAQWAELAGQGYRVVAAVPQANGGATLYLERLGARGATLTLPAQIAPATADAIRRRLRERQAEPASAPQR